MNWRASPWFGVFSVVFTGGLFLVSLDVGPAGPLALLAPVPLLIYLANSPIPDKQTRKFSTEQLPVIYSAMAMVCKPGLSKFIMNTGFR